MCLCLMHLHASTQHSNRFDACSRGGSGQQPHPSCGRAAAARQRAAQGQAERWRHTARWACGPRVTVPGGARLYIFDSNEFRAPFSESNVRFRLERAIWRTSLVRMRIWRAFRCALRAYLHTDSFARAKLARCFRQKARKFARSISALPTCSSPALPCRRQQLMDGFLLGRRFLQGVRLVKPQNNLESGAEKSTAASRDPSISCYLCCYVAQQAAIRLQQRGCNAKKGHLHLVAGVSAAGREPAFLEQSDRTSFKICQACTTFIAPELGKRWVLKEFCAERTRWLPIVDTIGEDGFIRVIRWNC